MRYILSVTNPNNQSNWTRMGESPDEFLAFKNISSISRASYDPSTSLFMPIRTNNLHNLAKDVFFPTTMEYAIKVENIALRILAILGSVILDTVTLPFRIITCLPRICYNNSQPIHPLYTYLVTEGASTELLESVLESGRVQMRGALIDGHSFERNEEQELDFSYDLFSTSLNCIEHHWAEFFTSQQPEFTEKGETIGFSALAFPSMLAPFGITNPADIEYLMPQPTP